MENKMSEVAKLLGVELEEEFKVYGWDGFYKISELGLKRYVKGRSCQMDHVMLIDLIKGTAKIIKLPKPILDDVEKKYLSNIIKPFRNKVKSITKYDSPCSDINCHYIQIKVAQGYNYEYICLPYFIKGTMYKGMENDKNYTLKDLGL